MAKDNKHNAHDPSIRGGSRKHEMDRKKRLYQLSGGRPAQAKKSSSKKKSSGKNAGKA